MFGKQQKNDAQFKLRVEIKCHPSILIQIKSQPAEASDRKGPSM